MMRTSGQVPYYVRALAMGVPAYLIGVHLWSWVFMAPFYLGGHSDFRQIYAAAHMVRTGQASRLYDPLAQEEAQNTLVGVDQIMPFVRPAYELLLFLPLTFFPYRIAYFMLLAGNLILLALIYGLMRPRMQNLAKIFSWLPAALFLAFLPIAGTLIQGQDSILLVMLLTASLVAMDRGQNTLAGLLIGLGMFKFQLTIPLSLIFVLWRRWDFCKGVFLSAIPAALISVWITGLTQLRVYIRLLLFIGKPSPLFRGMANLHGLVFGLFGTRLSPGWIAAITGGLSAILLAYVASQKLSGSHALLYALTASTALSYYLFFHDISALFLPIVITLDRYLLEQWSPDDRKLVVLAAALFVLPLLLSYAPRFLYLMEFPLIGLLLAWRPSVVVVAAAKAKELAPVKAGPDVV